MEKRIEELEKESANAKTALQEEKNRSKEHDNEQEAQKLRVIERNEFIEKEKEEIGFHNFCIQKSISLEIPF